MREELSKGKNKEKESEASSATFTAATIVRPKKNQKFMGTLFRKKKALRQEFGLSSDTKKTDIKPMSHSQFQAVTNEQVKALSPLRTKPVIHFVSGKSEIKKPSDIKATPTIYVLVTQNKEHYQVIAEAYLRISPDDLTDAFADLSDWPDTFRGIHFDLPKGDTALKAGLQYGAHPSVAVDYSADASYAKKAGKIYKPDRMKVQAYEKSDSGSQFKVEVEKGFMFSKGSFIVRSISVDSKEKQDEQSGACLVTYNMGFNVGFNHVFKVMAQSLLRGAIARAVYEEVVSAYYAHNRLRDEQILGWAQTALPPVRLVPLTKEEKKNFAHKRVISMAMPAIHGGTIDCFRELFLNNDRKLFFSKRIFPESRFVGLNEFNVGDVFSYVFTLADASSCQMPMKISSVIEKEDGISFGFESTDSAKANFKKVKLQYDVKKEGDGIKIDIAFSYARSSWAPEKEDVITTLDPIVSQALREIMAESIHSANCLDLAARQCLKTDVQDLRSNYAGPSPAVFSEKPKDMAPVPEKEKELTFN